MLTGLHSALVDVADLATAASDYARMLGRAPVRIESDAQAGTRSVFFALANTALELRAWDAPLEDRRLGQSGLRFACDAENAAEVLAARGLSVESSAARVGKAEAISGTVLPDRAHTLHSVDPDASRGIPVDLVCSESVAIESRQEDPGVGRVAPEAQLSALDHVVVMSAAPDATRDFYADGLGLRLALDKSFEHRGVRLLFFRVGGVTVEIGARLLGAPNPGSRDRFGGLAWQTPSIEATQARLLAEGFDVSEVRDGHKPGTRVCTVRDPVHQVPTLLIEPVGRG